jgi:hypothetical protein
VRFITRRCNLDDYFTTITTITTVKEAHCSLIHTVLFLWGYVVKQSIVVIVVIVVNETEVGTNGYSAINST